MHIGTLGTTLDIYKIQVSRWTFYKNVDIIIKHIFKIYVSH